MITKHFTKSEYEARQTELRPLLSKLLFKICFITELSIRDLTGKSKKPVISDVRSSFMSIAKERHYDASLSLIGYIINRNHSTVSAGIKRANEVREVMILKEAIKCLID